MKTKPVPIIQPLAKPPLSTDGALSADARIESKPITAAIFSAEARMKIYETKS